MSVTCSCVRLPNMVTPALTRHHRQEVAGGGMGSSSSSIIVICGQTHSGGSESKSWFRLLKACIWALKLIKKMIQCSHKHTWKLPSTTRWDVNHLMNNIRSWKHQITGNCLSSWIESWMRTSCGHLSCVLLSLHSLFLLQEEAPSRRSVAELAGKFTGSAAPHDAAGQESVSSIGSFCHVLVSFSSLLVVSLLVGVIIYEPTCIRSFAQEDRELCCSGFLP